MTSPTDKHDAILAAALALFVERGYHGTAVPAIADRAGVAAGTIYHHFESKEQLVNAVFKLWKERIAREVHEHFPVTATPREQFRAMWNQLSKFAFEHPEASLTVPSADMLVVMLSTSGKRRTAPAAAVQRNAQKPPSPYKYPAILVPSADTSVAKLE